MNINMDMLKGGKGNVDDRLWTNKRDYLGAITELTDTTITLRNGIFENTYYLEDIYWV